MIIPCHVVLLIATTQSLLCRLTYAGDHNPMQAPTQQMMQGGVKIPFAVMKGKEVDLTTPRDVHTIHKAGNLPGAEKECDQACLHLRKAAVLGTGVVVSHLVGKNKD